MNQATPEKKAEQQNRRFRVPWLCLACLLMMSTGLLRESNWKLALQLVIGLGVLALWICMWFRGTLFENRFEMLLWTGVLFGTVCDVLAFKAGYYLFGAVALVGMIGWQGRTPPAQRS